MTTTKLIRDTSIIHRFSDVAGEPCTMLPPIEGFNNYPLVSLEEAIEPLIPIVQDVKERATIAKNNSKDPSDDLSSDQSAAIVLYTMEWESYTSSLYYILNSSLRKKNREKLRPWFLYLKLLFTALSRLPSIRLTIYRSLKMDTQLEYEKYQEGKDVIWWAFSSCSTNKNISQKEHFLTATGTRTLFIIECLNGKDIGAHSYNKNDQEVLLLPATQFQVVRCDRRLDDIHKIYLKEIKPQTVLLEPVYPPPIDRTSETSTPSSTRKLFQNFIHRSVHDMFED